MKYKIFENEKQRSLRSEAYSFDFNKETGFFARWGKTQKDEDDPIFSPFGPEILDLEISVNGCPNNCPFCYKGNSNEPATNMSFDTFKAIFDKMPRTLTQVAFGITSVQTNPDFLKMMHYSRENNVIPNFTLSGIDLTDDLAEEIAGVCGALAVSAYESDKNICYDTVQKFTDLGMDQVNIHLMVSKETMPFVKEVLSDRCRDPSIAKMNAIVFLGVKNKSRAINYNSINAQDYANLVKICKDLKISYGFDSCSAPKFEYAVKNMDISEDEKQNLIMCSESCESGLFSSYINVEGNFFPCSFTEGEGDWDKGIDVVRCNDFIKDVWYNKRVVEWRNNLINNMCDGCRLCPTFPNINP